MTARTPNFRTTLIKELELLASPELLHAFQRSNPGLDAREEAVSSLVDYYTDELLSFDDFLRHFSAEEVLRIKDTVRQIAVMRPEEREQRWEEVRLLADALLLALRRGEAGP